MLQACPENGARLLDNIPRLENVAKMIRQQQTVDKAAFPSISQRGACMLRIAIEVDRQRVKTDSYGAALRMVRAILRGFPEEMLLALEDYVPPEVTFDVKRLPVLGLRVSMILEEDVFTTDGNCMVVQKGTTLNAVLVERISNFAQTRGIREPIAVRGIRL
jgi:hypothetical protein